MYKILLADDEGVVLRSLSHMIYARFGEDCDVRLAQTAGYTRVLARKFLPDAAIINIQMTGMHGFDIIREIQSFHSGCIFITVAASNKPYLQLEAKNRNVTAHLSKPLSRSKVMPALENAAALITQGKKRAAQNRLVWEKFGMAVPYLENDLISQLFFPDRYREALPRYRELLGISEEYGRVVALLFREPADADPGTVAELESHAVMSCGAVLDSGASRNPVGCAIHLHRDYMQFYDMVKKELPGCLVGGVLATHVFLLLPCAKGTETPGENAAFLASLDHLAASLNAALPGLSFRAFAGGISPLANLRILPAF